jgi:NAD(P)H-dependent FMN reductase
MKPVVIYYSFTGNNKQLANELQRRLRCDDLEVKDVRKRTRLTILADTIFARKPAVRWPQRDLRQYDAAVLVAPIWAGRIAAPLKTFIAEQKDALPHFAFISLCSGVPGQPERIAAQLQSLTGRKADAVIQLNVNALLPPECKNRVRYTNAYRATAQDMRAFDKDLDGLMRTLRKD